MEVKETEVELVLVTLVAEFLSPQKCTLSVL